MRLYFGSSTCSLEEKDTVFILRILQMMAGNMCVKATPRFSGGQHAGKPGRNIDFSEFIALVKNASEVEHERFGFGFG